MVLINVKGIIRSFSVVRHTSSSHITMSGASEGGKATGTRPWIVSTRSNGCLEEKDNYPAKDVRLYRMEGSGIWMERSGSQRPRHVPRYTCGTCHDLCCGLARELVTTAFGLGRSSLSRWISKVISIFFRLIVLFRTLTRQCPKGWRGLRPCRVVGTGRGLSWCWSLRWDK